MSYFRLLANEKDDIAYLRVINVPPRASGKTTVENILEKVRQKEGTLWEILLAEAKGLGRSAPKLRGFTDLVLKWRDLIQSGEMPLPLLAERIINDVGYKDLLRKDDDVTADERIANLDEMINAMREFDEEHPGASIEAFLQDISLLTDGDKKVDTSKGAVTLMTIHMSKGLEFNTVHIAGCDEGIFPLSRGSMTMTSNEINEQLEEERRLFYVGCTRAEKKLYLYHAERRFFQGNIRPFGQSRFLKELDPSVVDFVPCTQTGFGAFGGFGDDFDLPSKPNISRGLVRRPVVTSHSIHKNDKRIVYHNPIKVENPVKAGPRVVYDEFSENPYRPGVRVSHVKYGIGVVSKFYGSGDDARVDVRFSNGITRTIILKYAALQIVH